MKKIKVSDIYWGFSEDGIIFTEDGIIYPERPEEVIIEDFTEEEIDRFFSIDPDDENDEDRDILMMVNNWLYTKYKCPVDRCLISLIE